MALTPATDYPVAFAISDGNTTYQYIFDITSTHPTKKWQTFSAPLDSFNGHEYRIILFSFFAPWHRVFADGLQNVNAFHILTDYQIGAGIDYDQVYLDNIAVGSAVPIPPSLVLLGSGLLGLGGWRRFRKN